MLLALVFIRLTQNRNISVSIGSVSTVKNPFWSQRMPGFQFCRNDEYTFEYEYSFNERKTIIPFPNLDNETDYNDSGESKMHEMCKQTLKRKDVNLYKSLCLKDSFLKIYVGKSVLRVPFFKSESNEYYLYNDYHIIIDNSVDTIEPKCNVKPDNPILIKEGNEIDIKFFYEFDSEIQPTSSQYKSIQVHNPRHETWSENLYHIISIVSSILCFVTFLISLSFYWKYKGSYPIPLSEIWRIPSNLNNTFAFIILGLALIFISIYLKLIKLKDECYSDYIPKIFLTAFIMPIFIYNYISKTIGIVPDIPNWMTPCILYYIFFIGIPHAYTVLFGVFGSFRGFRIRYIAFFDPFYLISLLIFIRGIGPLSYLLKVNHSLEPVTGQTSLPTKKSSCFVTIANFIYVFISTFTLIPLSNHLFDIFFDDAPVNEEIFYSTLILFISIASLFSLIHALPKTLSVSKPWQCGFFSLNFAISIFEVIYILFYAIFQNGIINIQALLMVGVFTAPYFISIICIGCAIFYIVPFFTIFYTFMQPKSV